MLSRLCFSFLLKMRKFQVLNIGLKTEWRWHALIPKIILTTGFWGKEAWRTMGQDRPKCKETRSHSEILLTLNFLVVMYPYWSLGVPLVPKSQDILIKLFRVTRYVQRFLRFHWNHYIAFPDFSDVWPSRGYIYIYIYNWCQDLSFRRKLRPCKSC